MRRDHDRPLPADDRLLAATLGFDRILEADRSVAAAAARGDRAQLAAQELAGGTPRQRLQVDVAARSLEVGDAAVAAEAIEVERGRGRGVAGDASDRDLSPLGVGDAHHRDVAHRGVRPQHGLDLLGLDVLTAGADHVVDAAEEPDAAVRKLDRAVAGEVPAGAELLGGGVGAIEIAAEDGVGGGVDQELAFAAGSDRAIEVGEIGDAHATAVGLAQHVGLIAGSGLQSAHMVSVVP